MTLLLLITTPITLAAAVYAQYRIPFHTPSRGGVYFSRLLLLVLGLAFGYVLATLYLPVTGVNRWLIWLTGFGLVHVPAAVILFIKRRRGEGMQQAQR